MTTYVIKETDYQAATTSSKGTLKPLRLSENGIVGKPYTSARRKASLFTASCANMDASHNPKRKFGSSFETQHYSTPLIIWNL